jgi:hypothetical protein
VTNTGLHLHLSTETPGLDQIPEALLHEDDFVVIKLGDGLGVLLICGNSSFPSIEPAVQVDENLAVYEVEANSDAEHNQNDDVRHAVGAGGC